MKEKKSDGYSVALPNGITRKQIMSAVEWAAADAGLYISHIGGYSRKKYPNVVHWHFKRDAKELMIRHSEPRWVKDMVPVLLRELNRQMSTVS